MLRTPRPLVQGSHLHPGGKLDPRKASRKTNEDLERESFSPSSRFAGLSSTIRGHSHPTMREELEKGGEARQAPASYNSSSHYRVSHTAQAEEKLSIEG